MILGRRFFAYVDGGCPGNGRSANHMFGSYVVYDVSKYNPNPTHQELFVAKPHLENLRFSLKLENHTQRLATNNMAETLSMLQLLSTLTVTGIACPDNLVTVFCDSELVLNQLAGVYKVKQPHLRQVHVHIRNLIDRYAEKHPGFSLWDCVELEWIPGDLMKQTRVGH